MIKGCKKLSKKQIRHLTLLDMIDNISKMEQKVADLEDETIRERDRARAAHQAAYAEATEIIARLTLERDRACAAHQEATEIIARQDAKIDELQQSPRR